MGKPKKNEMTINDRIRAARLATGMTQEALAARAGIPLSSYRKYERETEPGVEAVTGLVAAGLAPNWLLTGEGPMLRENFTFPLRVGEGRRAGYKIEKRGLNFGVTSVPIRNLHQDAGEYLPFSTRLLSKIGVQSDRVYLMSINGDAMYPTLKEGWLIMVDPDRRNVSSGLYVMRQGDEEVCKRLESLPGGVIRVISDNQAYPQYDIDPNSGFSYEVIGKVVWFGGVV